MHLSQQFFEKLTSHTRLNGAERDALLGLDGSIVALADQSDLVERDAEVNTCCLVLEGMVARVGHTVNGRRQIAALHVPGDMPDIYALLIPQAIATLQAVCSSRILRVPRTDIRNVILRYPAIAEALWRETMMDARIATEWILNIGQRPARARVAHLICEIAQRVVLERKAHFGFAFPISQGQIADATGISNVHVNRVLKELRLENVVELSRSRADVHDWDRLRDIAEFDASYLVPLTIERLTPE